MTVRSNHRSGIVVDGDSINAVCRQLEVDHFWLLRNWANHVLSDRRSDFPPRFRLPRQIHPEAYIRFETINEWTRRMLVVS